jgi:hypothetical protein
VFVPDGRGGARFAPLPAPTDGDVAEICARVARRILPLIDGDGRDDDDHDDDGAGARLTNAARSPMGTLPFTMMPPPPAKRLTAAVDDVTLHADTAVAAHDRDGLDPSTSLRVIGPWIRRPSAVRAPPPPPDPSGQVAYRVRRPWFTGQTEIVLAPLAFLQRLAALIPPPRQNQTRYHGVFAANATPAPRRHRPRAWRSAPRRLALAPAWPRRLRSGVARSSVSRCRCFRSWLATGAPAAPVGLATTCGPSRFQPT